MKREDDVLARAAAELRAASSGHSNRSGFTRARIFESLHQRRRRRLRRLAVGLPLATVLLGGSAWAQLTHNWSTLVSGVAALWAPSAVTPPARTGTPAGPAVTPREPATVEPATVEPPVDRALPELPEARALKRVEATTPSAVQPPVAPLKATARQPEPAADPEPPDPELASFRKAHDLHYAATNPAAALAAYDNYLSRFPSGRFVPEARYNRALNQIKLGQTQAARRGLAPFARGDHGHYRQQQARDLLRALER